MTKNPSPRNKTLVCDEPEMARLADELLAPKNSLALPEIIDRVIWGDAFEVAPNLPGRFADLLILDPPYNHSKNYNGQQFKKLSAQGYGRWFEAMVCLLQPTLKADASVYVCADWETSVIIAPILQQHFKVRNRITWERDKGRRAKHNWKNNAEDIWFCTNSDGYHYDESAVMLKRRVIAPYKINGQPKDWAESPDGNYRLTGPSNIWTDITVPFWSMPENTGHPTQKPEKLIAKLILASSRRGELVLDPFLGSGTTAVVARKLGRRFCGIEIDQEFACWSLKRLALARQDNRIQGHEDGVFWERNSHPARAKPKPSYPQQENQLI